MVDYRYNSVTEDQPHSGSATIAMSKQNDNSIQIGNLVEKYGVIGGVLGIGIVLGQISPELFTGLLQAFGPWPLVGFGGAVATILALGQVCWSLTRGLTSCRQDVVRLQEMRLQELSKLQDARLKEARETGAALLELARETGDLTHRLLSALEKLPQEK